VGVESGGAKAPEDVCDSRGGGFSPDFIRPWRRPPAQTESGSRANPFVTIFTFRNADARVSLAGISRVGGERNLYSARPSAVTGEATLI